MPWRTAHGVSPRYMVRPALLAGTAGLRFADVAGRYEPYLPGRGGGAFPVGSSAGAVLALVHHLFRSAAVVHSLAMGGRGGTGAGGRGRHRSPQADRFSAEPGAGIDGESCGPVPGVHGLSRRTGPAETGPPSSHRVLPAHRGGRRVGRPVRRHHCAAGLLHVPRVADRHGGLGLAGGRAADGVGPRRQEAVAPLPRRRARGRDRALVVSYPGSSTRTGRWTGRAISSASSR